MDRELTTVPRDIALAELLEQCERLQAACDDAVRRADALTANFIILNADSERLIDHCKRIRCVDLFVQRALERPDGS